MKFQKRISMGSFLKKGVDFKDGDILIIRSEGKEVPGEFGTQNVFMLSVGDKEGNLSLNQTSINGLIDAYGEDSIKWIDKQVKAIKVKQNVAGKFIDVWYFAHPDAELTEQGFVIDNLKDINDIPVIEGEISIDETPIPF